MSKYDPLQAFLSRRDGPITLALDELDLMLRGGLPRSAYEDEAWWSDDARPHSRSWRQPGFHADTDLTHRQVRFVPMLSRHMGTARRTM